MRQVWAEWAEAQGVPPQFTLAAALRAGGSGAIQVRRRCVAVEMQI
jgi:hypothetical protein